MNSTNLSEKSIEDKSSIKQVKSKQRVADHGEVFTAEREVNAKRGGSSS